MYIIFLIDNNLFYILEINRIYFFWYWKLIKMQKNINNKYLI
jgi:hypothetical protein